MGTYVYDFAGSGSDVGSWRDASEDCGHSKCQLDSDSSGGCNPTGGDCNSNDRPKKRLPFVSTRMQNSIISYDKYLIVYSFQFMLSERGKYGAFNGIYYMNVETEEWTFGGNLAEPCKFDACNNISSY